MIPNVVSQGSICQAAYNCKNCDWAPVIEKGKLFAVPYITILDDPIIRHTFGS
jgi:hypothetical protein